jgi:membrane protein YdbS with pleckstrin-like domain
VGIATLLLVVVAVVVVALGAVVWGLALLGAALVLGVLVERSLKRRFSSWGYLERADDLLVRRGVLVSRLSVVPYGRMQFVDVTAGPLERSFGLATVRLHTAAAASDARIPGLERAEAARVRDQLAVLGESHLAGL